MELAELKAGTQEVSVIAVRVRRAASAGTISLPLTCDNLGASLSDI